MINIKASQLSDIDFDKLESNIFIIGNFQGNKEKYDEQLYSDVREYFLYKVDKNSLFQSLYKFNSDNTIEDVYMEYVSSQLIPTKRVFLITGLYVGKDKNSQKVLKNIVELNDKNTIVAIFDTNGTFSLAYDYANLIDISKLKNDDEYIDYLVQYAKRHSLTISKINAAYLFKKVNSNLKIATLEMDKIALYDLGYSTIEKDDIDMIVIDIFENKVYDISNALSKKDNEEVLRIISNCIRKGMSEEALFNSIARQYRLMFDSSISKLTNAELAKKLEVHEYAVKISRSTASSYNINVLKKIVDKLEEISVLLREGEIAKGVALQLAICFIMVN